MKSIIHSILCLTLWITPSLLNAQITQENITHYSELDGNNIFDVMSDQFGTIWITTHNGLLRFDGYEFTRFYNDPNDSSSISNSLVSSLFEDSKGRVWVGGAYDINMYDQKTKGFRSFGFDHLTGDGSSAQPWVITMAEDKTGRIYFGALDFFDRKITNSLYFYDELSDSIKKVDNPDKGPISNVNDLSTDPSGTVWGFGLNGIFRISLDGSVDLVQLPNEFEYTGTLSRRQSIASDQSGKIWVSSGSSKIHIYDPVSGSFEMFDVASIFDLESEDLFINRIEFHNDNFLWIATSVGIFQYNVDSGHWLNLVQDGSRQFSDLEISAFDVDSFGNLWMGTLQEGLLKYENLRLFNSYRGDGQSTQKITGGWVNRIFESADGTIWLSTSAFDSDGLSQIDFKNNSVKIIDEGFFGADWQFVVEFNEQRPGVFFLTDLSSMYSLDVSKMELSVVDTGTLPKDIGINKYFVDHNGTEWFGTNRGLYEIQAGQSDYIYHDLITHSRENLSSNVITNFVQDSTSGFWIITNDGLFYYNYSSKSVKRHAYDPSVGDVFASQDINSLLIDENGIVWVGTWAGGLSRYDTNTKEIETFTMADGLPSMSIQYILKDEERNDLWLSTFDGISRFELDTYQFVNYTTENGLHSQLFTDGAGLKTSDGLFIFGGSNGITYFRPADISKKSLPPSMFFTDFKIDDESQSFQNGIFNTERINLAHNQNNISIDYTGIHYSNPARNRFSFILENYDSGWRDVGLQRTAYYPNLPPGNYVFKVRAANSNGVWNEEGISLSIVINPPWWKTIWAYVIYTIMGIGLVIGIDRIQRQRLVRQEQERTRERELAQAKEIEKAYKNLEIAHENLKSAQNQLVQQEKLASLGQLTAGIAHEIKNPLNFVNNFSEVSLEMIDEAMDEARQIGENPHAQETIAILTDIKANLTKIHEHGSRADGIVKSMLMHSRGGTGSAEPTDLNALVREYVNLAFHGMRAGKHPINVDIDLDLEESVGQVPLIAEDFSRVILNLCNNSFDAMRQNGEEKREKGQEFAAKLSVRTKRDGDKVAIEIEDNGVGIPDDIKDKILQPFFTTKKGTQGTGLGLSITHDIVKAHGASLEIESELGRTVFKIQMIN